MSDPDQGPGQGPNAAQRRRMRRMGILLGVVTIALTAAFVVIFTVYGLPRDPTEYRRLQQRQLEIEQMHLQSDPDQPVVAPAASQSNDQTSGPSAATRTKQ